MERIDIQYHSQIGLPYGLKKENLYMKMELYITKTVELF